VPSRDPRIGQARCVCDKPGRGCGYKLAQAGNCSIPCPVPGSGTPDQNPDDAGPNGLERILNALGSALEPVCGFRSLLAFKDKFHPRYHTLFMTYPDSAALPGIAQALTRAYVPSLTPGNAPQILGRIIRRQNHQ
jgi:hypothetical protein